MHAPAGHTVASPDFGSPTVAYIDLSALAVNLNEVRRRISVTCDIVAVVKADAYGHGAVPIARALAALGVTRFGVATVQEGAQLREAGIAGSILIMGALLPEQCREAVSHRLTPVLHDLDAARFFSDVLPEKTPPYPVHLKVDTGMGRLGVLPEQVLPVLGSSPFSRHRLAIEGLMTHLADADNLDTTYTRIQLEQFQSLIGQLKTAGLSIPLIHAANSSAITCHPSSHFTLVRPGLMLYGYQTTAHLSTPVDLKPILTWTTKIVHVRSLIAGQSVSYNRAYTASRPTRVGVLPIGYADGYNRLLSNRGAVLIKGRRAPIVGRICMDMTMIDITHIPEASPGDEVVLIGQQGSLRLSAAHLASWSQTIPYETLCAIGPRVTRLYR